MYLSTLSYPNLLFCRRHFKSNKVFTWTLQHSNPKPLTLNPKFWVVLVRFEVLLLRFSSSWPAKPSRATKHGG